MSALGASLITFTPSTTVRSSDVNSNFSALNNSGSPLFTTLTVSSTSSFDGGKLTTDGNGNLLGSVGSGIPMTRNGVAVSVPIYTGTTTPVNPPTGSAWLKA